MKRWIAILFIGNIFLGCATTPFLPYEGMTETQVSELSKRICGPLVDKGQYQNYFDIKVFQTSAYANQGITTNSCGGDLYFYRGSFIKNSNLPLILDDKERLKLITQQGKVLTPSLPPVLSPNEKNILKANGFAIGKWSENCNDPNAYTSIYYEDGNRFYADVFSNSKKLRRAYYFEVRESSPGVIRFKIFSIGNAIAISRVTTTFANGRRFPIDVITNPVTGERVDKEIVQIKGGSEIYYEKNGNVSKILPTLPSVKCD